MEPTDQEAEAKMRHHWTRVQQVKKNLQDNGCVSSNTFAEILLNEGADLLTMLKNNSFMMSSMADSLPENRQKANTNENNDEEKSFDGIDRRVALLFKKTKNKKFKMLTIANAKQDEAEEDQEEEPSEVPLGKSKKRKKKRNGLDRQPDKSSQTHQRQLR